MIKWNIQYFILSSFERIFIINEKNSIELLILLIVEFCLLIINVGEFVRDVIIIAFFVAVGMPIELYGDSWNYYFPR